MNDLYPASDAYRAHAHIKDRKTYDERYRLSVDDPDAFWQREADRIVWFEPFSVVRDVSFAPGEVHISWYRGGKTNACYNALDRHLERHGDRTALIFEPDDPEEAVRHISYGELHADVCRMANILKERGVKKGDRVTIYLPMIPEAAIAMLACARIGAVHSVVFGGFSPDALASRIQDCTSDVVITADEGRRAGGYIPLKANTDKALEQCPDVHTVLVVRRSGRDVAMEKDRDIWYHEARDAASEVCVAEPMDAEDPLFILYTSGSTGKPKGLLHTTGGYQVYASITHEYVFDYHAGDVYWCTADVGWITGHTYMVYGPLINGATQVFFEGVPTWPDASRFWQVVEKHGVTQFYTAPTAIRALMRQGDEFVTRADRSSLRLLGTVGEPINPEAWRWYHEVVGEGRCPIVDTWWQTETGGIMITPLGAAIAQKPGSAAMPFFGIEPVVLGADGRELEGEAEGILAIRSSWPGQARTIYRDHGRFMQTYFSAFDNYYFTGDGCRRDGDGYFWITGRVDDVINVSGHRMGTAEVESALVAHHTVAEAAVVGMPHDIKGQGIYCYVTLNEGVQPTGELQNELRNQVRRVIGPIATPDFIQFAPSLPKTRSGKIMRRILKALVAGEDPGDTTTLENPDVPGQLAELLTQAS